MLIDIEMPYTCYVIVAKDKRGFRRGFEKCMGGRFWLNYGEALDSLRNDVPPGHQLFYTVAECVIGYPPDEPRENPI